MRLDHGISIPAQAKEWQTEDDSSYTLLNRDGQEIVNRDGDNIVADPTPRT